MVVGLPLHIGDGASNNLGLSRPGTGAAGAAAANRVPTLPLRADVLLSNTLFEELDNGISEDFLKHYLGTDELEEADFLEIQVDSVSGAEGVECIGQLLPSLTQLRLNQSNVGSVRDLGTSLRNLRVLWLCRSSVQDLGGISCLPQLEELYVAFNDICDLTPLSTHETIQVLDLEGNLVENKEEVLALEHVSSLRELNLTMNPLWKAGHVSRADVLEALPQLEVLDDMPRDSSTSPLDDVSDDDSEFGELPDFVDASELAMAEPLSLQGGGLSTVPEDDYQASSAVLALKRRAKIKAEESTSSEGASPLKEAWGLHSWGEGQSDGECSAAPAAVAAPLASGSRAGAEAPSSPGSWSEPASSAVAELHARLASVECQSSRPPSSCGEKRIELSPGVQAQAVDDQSPESNKSSPIDEPSEQDLILEGLKRAPRLSASWQSNSARPASRCGTPSTSSGFQPSGRRTSCGALSSVASSASTMYRPSTSSGLSELNSSRSLMSGASVVEFEGTSSDLTGGDDGSALVGTPLAAIRRRRQINRAQGDEDMNIRTLMKRFDFIRERFHRGDVLEEDEAERAAVDASPPSSCLGGLLRPGTPDVRVGPARLLEKGPPGASLSKAKGGDTGSRPPRPGSRSGTDLSSCGVGRQGAELFGSSGSGFGASCFMRTQTGAEVLSMEPIELS